MSLAIVSAIIVGATTLCCPFIRGYYQTNENQQSEKITADLVDEAEDARSKKEASKTHLKEIRKIIIKPNTERDRNHIASVNTNSSTGVKEMSFESNISKESAGVLAREKEESAETRKGSAINCNPTSYDNGRFSKYQLAEQTLAVTTAIMDCIESCEKTGLQTITISLSKSANSSLPVGNELREEQISVPGINIDSSKSVFQIPESNVPRSFVTNSAINLRNLRYHYSLVNRTINEEDETYHIQLPANQRKFMQDIEGEEKDKAYLQSTKIGSKCTRRNTLFKKLRKFVQPLSAKLQR